jgi:HSP20 family protein
MALVRWNPARELAGMEIDRLNRMFTDFYGEAFARGWVPAVDIHQATDGEVVIKAELPDVKREDINITIDKHVLTLAGERKLEESVSKDGFHLKERFHGSFSRSFTLPTTVDAGRVQASYKDGLLTIRLPQREDAKPKQIAVNVD